MKAHMLKTLYAVGDIVYLPVRVVAAPEDSTVLTVAYDRRFGLDGAVQQAIRWEGTQAVEEPILLPAFLEDVWRMDRRNSERRKPL